MSGHANYTFQYDYNRLYDLYYMTGLSPIKCVLLRPSMIMLKTASICIGSSTLRSGSSLSAVYGALISVLFMAKRKLWVIKISHCRKGIPGNHIPAFYWQHCRQGSGRTISKNSKPQLNSGIQWRRAGRRNYPRTGGHGYNIRRNGVSNYTVMKNSRIVFIGKIPDHTDDIKSTKDIPSWKRMCFCNPEKRPPVPLYGLCLTRQQQKLVDVLKKNTVML